MARTAGDKIKFMAFDVHNPWHAVAYFTFCFSCEDCEKSLDINSENEPCSDEWCEELAKLAFDSGWFIRHPSKDGSMDVGTAWCPDCGSKHKLTQPAYKTFVKQTG
jgi:hypothetical protein